jgi:hypothetical protein
VRFVICSADESEVGVRTNMATGGRAEAAQVHVGGAQSLGLVRCDIRKSAHPSVFSSNPIVLPAGPSPPVRRITLSPPVTRWASYGSVTLPGTAQSCSTTYQGV